MNEHDSQAAALATFLARNSHEAPAVPGSTVIYRALPGAYFDLLPAGAPPQCLQTSKPLADELERLGCGVVAAPAGPFSRAIVFATKHREEVLHHMALAAEGLAEGGELLVVAANTLGAPSLERRCAELMGGIESFSKHKCKVIRSVKRTAGVDAGLLAQWREAGELRRVPATGCYACPGIFSWKSIDAGSRLLAAHLPASLRGRGADLGAGYGFLSHAALKRAPGIEELHLFEAERKALDAARRNLADGPQSARLEFHWADVTAGLDCADLDFVIMNPPFHAGRGAVPDLGRAFVRAALRALRPGGRLLMVANRHLPYESEIQQLSGVMDSAEQDQGYKVILAHKAA